MKVDVGVIGAGWVASERHLKSLARNDAARVVSVFDRDLGRARRAAPPGALAVNDLTTFFDRDLDLVIVATPPWLHVEHVVAALGHGAHVLCEKPLAMNSTEAVEMFDTAEIAGVALCPVHNFLWSHSMRRASSLIVSDRPRHVSAIQFSSDARRLPDWSSRLPGGLLFDEIPHMLYSLAALGAGEPSVVDVRVDWQGRTSEPAVCEVALDVGGVPASLTAVFGTPVSEWHITRVGVADIVDVDLFRDVCVSTGDDGPHTASTVLALSARVAARHFVGFGAAGVRQLAGRQFWGHDGLIDDFISRIADSRRSGAPVTAPVSREEALAIVGCADQIVAAVDRG